MVDPRPSRDTGPETFGSCTLRTVEMSVDAAWVPSSLRRAAWPLVEAFADSLPGRTGFVLYHRARPAHFVLAHLWDDVDLLQRCWTSPRDAPADLSPHRAGAGAVRVGARRHRAAAGPVGVGVPDTDRRRGLPRRERRRRAVVIDVAGLREAARGRARARPQVTFDGDVHDGCVGDVSMRSYRPAGARDDVTVVFCHGGYGIFGDLDLQDGHCRRLAAALGARVVSVDYGLAPEHTFAQAVLDVVTCAVHASGDVVLCGDSAGAALCVAAASRLGPRARALVLTSPNLDLTMSSIDPSATEGPDVELSRASFTAWVGPVPLAQAPRLDRPVRPLTPAFVAVGSRDALLGEALALAAWYEENAAVCELHVVEGAGHGFASDPHRADTVLRGARVFLDRRAGRAQ